MPLAVQQSCNAAPNKDYTTGKCILPARRSERTVAPGTVVGGVGLETVLPEEALNVEGLCAW